MDPTISQGLLYSDSDNPAESHNFPNGRESNRNHESFSPSRPSSRLGFNRTILSPNSLETPSESEAVQWSHSLFQNVGISALRLSSIKPLSQVKAAVMEQASTPDSALEQNVDPSNSSDYSPPVSAHEHVSDNLSRSLVVSRPSPKKSRPSVSRLCFPFVTTSSPRHKKTSPPTPTPPPTPRPSPPPRHKYSCFPSLMSPSSPGRALPKHQRHNYRQHGYSRMALEQVKWFWSTRSGKREGPNSLCPEASAREGISSIEQSFHPTVYPSSPNIPAGQTSLSPEAGPPPLPPMSVHPRRGDIKALRDPYAVHIDRAFVDVPTWTIGKALWMSELHVAMDNLATPSQSVSEEDVSEGDSDSELEASATTSSDDSDATLVESESENDLPTFYSSKPPSKLHKDLLTATTPDIGSSSAVGVQPTPYYISNHPKSLGIREWLHSIVPVLYIPPSNSSLSRKRKWTINWYQRWELLVGLSRHDQNRTYTSSEVEAPPLVMRPLANNTRRFLLADKSAEPNDDSWSARLDDAEA